MRACDVFKVSNVCHLGYAKKANMDIEGLLIESSGSAGYSAVMLTEVAQL